ncbi:MAG: DUF494 domain-containing protein [Ignavibacteria bacterium]|nr:DUF494 domain-containing protein [Ignavibacteria bacterium]
MKQRIIEILVQLMSEMQVTNRISDIDLGELKNRGYTQTEISEALSWLYTNLDVDDGVVTLPVPVGTGSRRIFHEVEKSAFSIESQGYLIQLRELGLLDDRDMEVVIERAMQTGYDRLSIEEVKEIVTSMLFGKGGASNRSWLNNKESIH